MIRCWYALPITVLLATLLAGRAQTSPPRGPATDDYSQEAAVIEEISTRIAFDNDGNFTREQSSRVRVQTDAGVQQWGLLKFPLKLPLSLDYANKRYGRPFAQFHTGR